MADTAVERLRETSGLHASPPEYAAKSCTACGGGMQVQKTVLRHGVTIQHGRFSMRERVLMCASGCRQPSGALMTDRPAGLAAHLLPRSVFGYDVMATVGVLRFVHFRQREEIQRVLAEQHGITLSTGQVSNLGRRFLEYLERLHRSRAPALRAALEADGGWPMHVDATCEDGRGTLLVVLAGWRRWVVAAGKVSTESSDSIRPYIEDAASLFGMPCAAMRDLGKAVIKALDEFKSAHQLHIPVLSCHFHFLADLGRDLLDGHYRILRNRVRHHAVRKELRGLARELGRKLGNQISRAREELIEWQQALDAGHQVPEGRAGLAVVRGVAQWVLDYGTNSEGLGFPFDQPLLDLYLRCQEGLRAVDAFLRVPPEDSKVRRVLMRLQNILIRIASDDDLARTARELRYRVRLLARLRDALRLQKGQQDERQARRQRLPEPISESDKARVIHNVRASLARLIRQLRKERPQRGPGQDRRKAIDTILEQFQRHRRSLWGHEIQLPEHAGGGIRLVNRTNNDLEGEFHKLKHGERRRSGRKNLTQDLEALPAETMLARNLSRPDYVEILCGSLANLAATIAELDQPTAHEGDGKAGHDPREPSPETVLAAAQCSASLPTADRRLVRSEEMYERISNAARSRAPRSSCLA